MAPPRDIDIETGPPGEEPVAYADLVDEIAQVQGVINQAEARLVAVARQAIDLGISGGDALTVRAWLAWRAGVSPGRANEIVKLAERAEELPATIAALEAGRLTVDQAAVIARNIAPRYDESAARVAQSCTVAQLRKTLTHYGDRERRPEADPDRRQVSTGRDQQGWWMRVRLPDDEAARVEQFLRAKREDLWRESKAVAKALDVDPQFVTDADAFMAGIDLALDAERSAHPGTDRYLVHAHLTHGPEGIELAMHLGLPLPAGQRRRLLCDTRLRGIVHDGVTPVGIGRTVHIVNRRLRRIIEQRDGGCAVPGCGRLHGLEIHHILHWEDGGPTESWNLITLCAHHHRCHHEGTLDIVGNADQSRHTAPGVMFTNAWGRQLEPVGLPSVPTAATVAEAAADIGIAAHAYQSPTGERLDLWGFHLVEGDPPPSPAADHDRAPDATPPPNAPGSPGGTDPTRAGPAA